MVYDMASTAWVFWSFRMSGWGENKESVTLLQAGGKQVMVTRLQAGGKTGNGDTFTG